jgi:hypothetical protein
MEAVEQSQVRQSARAALVEEGAPTTTSRRLHCDGRRGGHAEEIMEKCYEGR